IISYQHQFQHLQETKYYEPHSRMYHPEVVQRVQ
ncbi:hypothetical protein Tco_0621193, partial [Tanacetum coccineum]